MKREGTIGAASLLAIAAMVGVSLQSGIKPDVAGRAETSAALKGSKSSAPKGKNKNKGKDDKLRSGCATLQDALDDFLDIENLVPPPSCYEGPVPSAPDLSSRTAHLKFVIATLPDPVHTHLPVLFDQFAVSIQEAAQDEKYDFDSSWLPWDEEDPPYALLADQKTASGEKERKEEQPGIILFRKQLKCADPIGDTGQCKEHLGEAASPYKNGLSKSYSEGLVVFVVGEEATEGIHKDQFRNALAWIARLKPKTPTQNKQVAILGPTFSGSFPSLTQFLSESESNGPLDLGNATPTHPLAVYSGSASSLPAATAFKNTFPKQVTFHSFVRDDDAILRRFCDYIKKEQSGFNAGRVAIISEDETAYGNSGFHDPTVPASGKANVEIPCPENALKLYYPRDISALRAAYQTKSLFDLGYSPQSADTQKRNLPSDLADPSGKVHDSIRTYGGNQTPLNQEAFLLEIVTALRAFHVHYIFLRGSNTLDQLFLTNFLRRGYPDGRIVIFGSDLMFIRERGATGLSGTMVLSTYPLFPLERDWTEHQSLPAADRVFSTDTSEGTYVALRLLLNDRSFADSEAEPQQKPEIIAKPKPKPEPKPEPCRVLATDVGTIFLPRIACGQNPIPDYSPPFWTLPDQCGELADKEMNQGPCCHYPGPATWLSVIGNNRFWPMASLTRDTPKAPPVDASKAEHARGRITEPGGRPTIPLEMKLFLGALFGFALFHLWCCWSGSYTAQPAFLAHFASNGKARHKFLVFCGSCCVAFMAIVTGWGCGLFSPNALDPDPGLSLSLGAIDCVRAICVLAWMSILANNYAVFKLAKDCSGKASHARMTARDFITWNYRATGLFLAIIFSFYLLFAIWFEGALLTENRVLTYWRAMHLTSGVSPLVPILLFFVGLYLSFWYTLHGLALFGPDRPRLPNISDLLLIHTKRDGTEERSDVLRMFSDDDAATAIEQAGKPLNRKVISTGAVLILLFFFGPFYLAQGLPVRSLGADIYAAVFLLTLDICCALVIVEVCRLCHVWEELKRLLRFLDRITLRRTLASLHGFSWGGVWRMSGNVLEVRYKVMSRQMESMTHTIASLHDHLYESPHEDAQVALQALQEMGLAGRTFATWYAGHYKKDRAGDLTPFENFQQSIAVASGTLLSKLLVPAWREEGASLLVDFSKDEKDEAAPHRPPLSAAEHIRNAEEFVCLNYLAFIQNTLGRLRTMTLNIMLLLIISTVAMSTYPFDPRQALSIVLIVLFIGVGLVVVKVYAEMHRDSTLSHVTNTKPGELGTEFWFKLVGFGLAPLLGLLARVFPGITDFIFSWVQPSLSSLK